MKNCCSALSKSKWRTSSSWRTAARRFQKVTYKLLMKSCRLSFSKNKQEEIARILAENKIFVKENHESILPEEITYFNVQNKCTNCLGRDFIGENQRDSLCKRQQLHPGINQRKDSQTRLYPMRKQFDWGFILSRNGQGKLNQNHPRGLAQLGNLERKHIFCLS